MGKYVTSDFQKILVIGVVVGIISGFGAYLFYSGLKYGGLFVMKYLWGYDFPAEGASITEIATWAPPEVGFLFLPIICIGALISGYLVYTFAPEAEGHGTDAAVAAFHGTGVIRRRVPLVKAVASIITISTGGSAGREGPTAQISAGFGSLVADKLGLSMKYRRIAIATGIGAGIGTIFKAPLGGAILAAEILYTRDFESAAIIPAFIASVIGYSIFGILEGFEPVFGAVEITWTVLQIPFFALLGVVCGLLGKLYCHSFYGTRDLFTGFFTRHGLPKKLKPVTGAFFIGLVFVIFWYLAPETRLVALGSIGSGYGFLQLMMYNMVPLSVLIMIPFVKIFMTSFTIGSGGSGGVFAPGLTIGGSAGAAVGMILHLCFPSLVAITAVPAFAVVGMIALFGGVANAPISVLIMVIEMTHNYSLLPPAMVAVAISYIVTSRDTIFRAQVETKLDSNAHRGEYHMDIAQMITVGEAMVPGKKVINFSPETSSREVVALMNRTRHTGYPVIRDGVLVGIVTVGDLPNYQQGETDRPVGECMTKDVMTTSPDQTLDEVLRQMAENSLHHFPVTDADGKCVGFLTTSDILRSYTRRMTALSKVDEE
ncbi:chloride channel protein [Methanogenium cariaci]